MHIYKTIPQALEDRLGWDSLTTTVERVYAGLPPKQRAEACVAASNYGEAGALSQLAAPGSLPPVISGHNNYFLWGPGTCTGQVLITVGYAPSDFQHSYAHITLAAVQRCMYCVDFENVVPIVVLSDPRVSNIIKQWPSAKHYD